MTEGPIVKSIRDWVFRELPIDPSDMTMTTYLDTKTTHSLLVIYHNWSCRLVSAQPRTVHLSSFVADKMTDIRFSRALASIILDTQTGYPLTKYLSRGVKEAVSPPRKEKPASRRRDLDLMLNSWGIHHLHLSTEVESDGFVSRDDPLLFAVFKEHDAYLLDIGDHGSWTSRRLLEILVQEFPNSGAFHVLKGVSGLSENHDDNSLKTLRKKRVNSALSIDGKVIIPSAGISLAGTTIAATRDSDMLLEAVENFEQTWAQNPAQIKDMVGSAQKFFPEDPEFIFECHETAGVGIYETKSKTFFSLAP